MGKKKIIQIIFIILTFGVSGYVLYSGFFSRSTPTPASFLGVSGGGIPDTGAISNSGISLGQTNQILPYQSQMDFSVVTDPGLQFDNIVYPVLSTSSDVGIYDEKNKIFTQPLIK